MSAHAVSSYCDVDSDVDFDVDVDVAMGSSSSAAKDDARLCFFMFLSNFFSNWWLIFGKL